MAMRDLETLPVGVIGAGPVGLAAAAHPIERGVPTRVYEAGPTVAASVREWGHVRLFSPWKYNTDRAATALLKRYGWQAPPGDASPTGEDLYEAYLKPLSETPEMAAVVEVKTTVRAITRRGLDKVATRDREKGVRAEPIERRRQGAQGACPCRDRRFGDLEHAEPARRERR